MLKENDMPIMIIVPYTEKLSEKTNIEKFYDGFRYSNILRKLDDLHDSMTNDYGLNGDALEKVKTRMKVFEEYYSLALRIEQLYGMGPLSRKTKEKFDENAKGILKLLGDASNE